MTGGPGRARILVGAVAAALVVTSCAAGPVRAENPYSPTLSWSEPAEAPTAGIGSMAFDPSTGQTIYFGGQSGSDLLNQTWSWDGSQWNLLSPEHSPPPRGGAELEFDANTGDLLLFGGQGPGSLTDTWTWDGSDWTQRFPADSPPSSRFDTMSFDAANGEMVLLIEPGGGQTWTWDGSNWTREFPANNPPARLFSASAFDPSQGNVVLFGGFDFTNDLGDTWIWNGNNWIEQSPAHSPGARERMSMAFNPLTGNVMLHGGMTIDTAGNPTDTWEWDGSDWTQVSAQSPSIGWVDNAMAFDAARGNMVYAGRDFTQTYGPPPGLKSAWFEQSPATTPPALNSAGSTFDQSTGTTVLFGGYGNSGFLNETWNWDGSNWSEANPATSPSARYYVDPGFDFYPSEGDAVLFAGNDDTQVNTLRNDTWTWSGTDWDELAPPVSPSHRSQSALAFDPSMGEMLLFGGSNSQDNLNETWTWDGTTWTQLNPPNSPPGRSGAGMAFDQSTGKMLMFGGGNENDTWTWDGTTWTEMSPATSPSPRSHPKLDFDPTSGDVVLYGGYFNGQVLADTWIWDGTNWTERTAPGGPGARSFPTMNFDANSSGMLLYGGYDGTSFLDETWTYELIADPPDAEIASPADGATFTIDEAVSTSFTCSPGAGGPAVDTCLDSNGDASPGTLDTSTPGIHAYSVTATAVNGQSGETEIEYEVVKTDPVLTVENATSTAIGGSVTADAVLASGLAPTGKITLSAYGPEDPTCSGSAALTYETPEISGNGTYPMPAQALGPAGDYNWVASYPGDANNEAATSACGAAGSISVIEKSTPVLKPVSATSNEAGEPVTFTVELTGSSDPGGTIVFRAYGPDDPTCSDLQFTSSPVPVGSDAQYRSPTMVNQAVGEFRWVAEYSGDSANEPASTTCGAPNSISTLTWPAWPVCPAVKLNLQIKTFKPNRRARHRQVPGIRVRVKTGLDVDADIRARYRYEMNGNIHISNLQPRTIRINGQRRLLFGVPKGMADHLRRATGQVSRNRVTFIMWANLRLHGAPTGCDQKAKNKVLNTRISGVSNKTALRTRPLAD